MKKIIIFILLLISVRGLAQFPVNSTNGTATTTNLTRGIAAADSGFWYRTAFADTTALNRGRIDEIAGVLVRTSSNELWLRNNTATGWIQVVGASGSVNIYNSNGTLTGNRILSGGNLYNLAFDGVSSFRAEANTGTGKISSVLVGTDSIYFQPNEGNFIIDSLNSGASTDSVLVWTQATGRVKKRSYSAFTPTWQQVTDAGASTTNDITLTSADLFLSYTTTASPEGIIYKGSNPFIHDYRPTSSSGRNTFVGELAGNLTMTSSGSTSSNITAIGYNAAHGNTTGFDYVSIGVNNLVSITEGGDHASVGNYVLQNCTTCTGFSALGYNVFGANVSGADGSAVGYDAFKRSTGSRNSGIGVRVGNDLVSGNDNTMLGFNSGNDLVGGSFNTLVGANIDFPTSTSVDSLLVLANGKGQQRLYVNGNGAWSLDGGSTFGTSGYFLTSTGSGSAPAYSNTLPSGTTLPISSLTAATGSNSIDNGGFEQVWSWSSGFSTFGLTLNSNTTTASNNSSLLYVQTQGANGTAGRTTYSQIIDNLHTGTSSTNIGLEVKAQNGTVNNALNIAAGALTLNGSAGTSGQVLTSAGANTLPTWSTPSSGLTVGTTTITSGTNTRILYNNSGVVGEYTLTGTGTVAAMQTSPSFIGNVGIAQGTITTDLKALDISTTWNAAGVAFTGLKLDVTNTASASTSKLVAVTQGITAGFWVDKNGQAEILTNSGAVGYGSQGLKLRDYSSGAVAVLQVSSAGSLYITNGSGTASALTLGTRGNPDDGTTFIASSGRWIINSGAFVVNRSTWLGITQNEVLSTAYPQYGGFYDASNYFTMTASSAGVATIAPTGASVTVTKPLVLKGYTVATLPAGVQGMMAFVTDGLAPAFLVAIVGGGAVVTPVFYDGTNWIAH